MVFEFMVLVRKTDPLGSVIENRAPLSPLIKKLAALCVPEPKAIVPVAVCIPCGVIVIWPPADCGANRPKLSCAVSIALREVITSAEICPVTLTWACNLLPVKMGRAARTKNRIINFFIFSKFKNVNC
jgi:hypothetical protein